MPAAAAGAAGEPHVTLHAPAVIEGSAGQASRGTTSAVTVAYGLQGGSDFRVGVNEHQVVGSSEQWRAAAWNAAATATLLNGAPLSGVRVDYDVSGRIDGPSAGALMTVGLLAVMRGDRIKPGITMTGAISPDGTIGPVGDVPGRLDGAKQAHAKTLLIPLGQGKSANASGKVVDVVALGAQQHLRVKEVADIYAAYKVFTGKTLPRPKSTNTVALSAASSRRVATAVKSQLAAYDASAGELDRLAPAIQSDLQSFRASADGSHSQAQKLTAAGTPAGAYQRALEAAGTANAIATTGSLIPAYLTQGANAFATQVKGNTAINEKLAAFVGALKTYTPKTVNDAAALVDGYGTAVDAISMSHYARDLLAASAAQTNPAQALSTAILGAVFYELAGTQMQSAKDVFELGKGGGGAKLSKLSVGAAAGFFGRAAAANLRAFRSLVVVPQGAKTGVGPGVAQVAFTNNDLGYALAQSAQGVIEGGLDRYFGATKTAGYAKLAAAVRLYGRSAQLLSKYSSLGAVNRSFEVAGIPNAQAMQSALGLGRSQAQRGIGVLRARKVSPTIVIGAYEVAGVDAPGGPSDQLNALGEYLSAFVGSRVLAYLGGFPATRTR